MADRKDILRKHIDDMWKCAHCSLCKYPPLANVRSARFAQVCCSMDYGLFHAWSGGGKLNMALSIIEDRIETISEEMKNAIFQCTLCGACDVSCKYSTELEVLECIFSLRQYIADYDTHPVHESYIKKAESDHNPYGEPHKARIDWIKNTSIASSNVIENMDINTLFFTGCTSAYRQQGMVQASAEILQYINQPFKLSIDEHCCGSPIYRVGKVNKAKEFFQNTIDMFYDRNIEEVITACPGCYSMFVSEYPRYLDKERFEIWNNIKFRHMTQVIYDAIKKKQIKFKKKSNKPIISYHDPCHLGRGAEPYTPEWEGTQQKVFNQITVYDPPKDIKKGAKGIYKEPREILKGMINCIDFVELYRREESSYCCGSGGGVKAAYPEMANNAARERLDEVEFVISETWEDDFDTPLPDLRQRILISACPFCKTNFEQEIEASERNLQYKDINELVWEMMEK